MTFRAKCVACLALAAVAGCGWRKQHLRADHGRSYDAAFAAQRAGREAARAVTGLDAQEAAIIAEGYRAGLAPRGETAKEPPLLLVAPPTRDRPQPLAPSVPEER